MWQNCVRAPPFFFFFFFYHKFDLHWISIHQKLFVSLVGMPLRVQSKDSKESESSGGPSFFSPEPVPPPAPLPSPFPPLPNPFLAQPPPHLFPHFPPNIPPPPLPPPLFPPPPIHSPCQPSGLHLNPPTVSAGNDGQSSEAYNQPLWEMGYFFIAIKVTQGKKNRREKSQVTNCNTSESIDYVSVMFFVQLCMTQDTLFLFSDKYLKLILRS